MLKSVLKRFFKGFVSGGIAYAVITLNAGTTISSFGDLKNFLITVGIAFVTGGLLALEKAMNWTPEPIK